jgi:uncharacterized membrane protein
MADNQLQSIMSNNLFRIFRLASIFTVLLLFIATPASAQTETIPEDEIFRAVVTEVIEGASEIRENDTVSVRQKLRLEGLDGEWDGHEFIFDGLEYDVLSAVEYERGDKVYAVRTVGPDGEESYYITGFVRSGSIIWLTLLFIVVVVAIGRMKGFRAILVLLFTLLIILKFMVPQILAGTNALTIGIVGSVVILLVAIYVTEGFNRSSHIAIASVTISLLFTGLLSMMFIGFMRLSGFESEDVMYLVSSAQTAIDLRGLLLVGIIIGTLGVLDDVVISQVAVVNQLKKVDPGMPKRKTYRKAMEVGVSHLSSMVNTLFLAYAGASLPLLMLFSVNDLAPLGIQQVVSNEMLATEISRTLVGSIGLVLAVPVATILAVHFLRPDMNKR